MDGPKLTNPDENVVGEDIKAIARFLNARRKRVTVKGGVRETSFHQAIALGAMYKKLLSVYPPEAVEVMERESTRIAELIGGRSDRQEG